MLPDQLNTRMGDWSGDNETEMVGENVLVPIEKVEESVFVRWEKT